MRAYPVSARIVRYGTARIAGGLVALVATVALVVGLVPAGAVSAAAAPAVVPSTGEPTDGESPTGADAVRAALDAGETLNVRTGLDPLPGGGVTGDAAPDEAEATTDTSSATGEVTVTTRDRTAEATDLPVTPRRSTGVESKVEDALDSEETVPVMVRLTEAPDYQALADGADEAAASVRSTSDDTAQAADAVDAARAEYVVDTLKTLADETQDDLAATFKKLETAGHASDVENFWIVNGFAATVDAEALNTLADHPDVASITLDETHELPEPVETDAGEPNLPTWSVENIAAPEVWGEYGVRGEGVTVGVMDGGVDGSHPALADSWRGRNGDTDANWWVGTGEDYPTPGDGNGHGTHVTGSIVGQSPGEVTGVAPGAEWMAAKIFNDGGATSDSIIHAAFEFMLEPGGDPANAPDVVNNSWGASDATRTEFWDDVSALVSAGIVPLFANGNDGPGAGTVGSPASYPHAIGIGATDVNDLIASFSSRGPAVWDGEEIVKPQVSGPGANIYSTWPTALDEDGYHTISGTSMATPHVAGVVALMLSAAPDLTIDDVRATLTDTARVESHMGELPNDAYGAGIVDAHAAVTRVAHAGELEGTITDAETGDPLEATLTVGDDVEVTSDPETGEFHAYVGEGAHDVVVEAYGYETVTSEVTITADQIVTFDAELVTVDTHQLTGSVSSADGGDPVSGATVTVDGTDLEPVRTADDGSFAIDVAAGTHVISVRATGFAPTSTEVELDGDVAVELALDPLTAPTADGWAQHQNNPGRTGYTAGSVGAPSLTEEWTTSVGTVTFTSPTVADGTVYMPTDSGDLTAIDLATGEERWSVEVSGNSVLRGAPLIADAMGGTVYTGGGADGGITALDAATGEVRWTTPTPDRQTIYAQPTLVDGTLYAATGPTDGVSDTLFALDPETGEVQWSTDVGELVYAGPAVADGYAVIGNGNDGRLLGLNTATGEVAWTLQRTADYFVGSPSIADGVVYAATTAADGSGGGSMIAVDLDSGSLLWEHEGRGDGQGSAPAVYGDTVIAGSHGTGVVTAYDRADGSVVWDHPISGAVSASALTSADGYVVVGSQLDNRIIALDAATGEEAWSIPTTANVTSSAAFAEGHLITVDGRGEMSAHAPRGTVTGTVDSGWAPLEATIRVAETGEEVTSDPSTGEYELSHLPGTYTVEFERYGKSTVTETVEIVAGESVTIDATLPQATSGSVGGQVVDMSGEPVADATVTIDGTTVRPATTSESGVFFFPTVFTGTYSVTVELDGYVPWSQEVEVEAGSVASLQAELRPYDVALVGDYQDEMVGVLTDLGYTVDVSTFAEVTEQADDYAAVVVNGYEDDPGQEGFDAFLAATDAAEASVIWLDQYGVTDGGISYLNEYLGDPAEIPHDLSAGDFVAIEPAVDHPLVDGLDVGETTQILGQYSGYSAFTGWSGTTVADVVTDEQSRAGGGVGFDPRTVGSTHVLLASLQARSWGLPSEDWTEAAHTLIDNAVEYASDAAFAGVTGVVTDAEGAPVADVTVASESGGQQTTTDDDGSYQLLVPGGSHDVTVSKVGYVTDTTTFDLETGETVSHDVTLQSAGTGTLTGTVTTGDGEAPIGEATVTVNGPDVTATTAGDGTYTLEDVPAGTWQVDVSAAGYYSSTAEVEVVRDDAVTHDVALDVSTRVGVVGDRSSDSVLPVLAEGELVGVSMTWTDTDMLADLDVVVLNGDDDPGQEAYTAFMAAADAAGVSVIFTDGRFSSEGSLDILREYAGYPDESGTISDGPITFFGDDTAHPVFDGLDPTTRVLDSDGRATTIEGYPGDVIARVSGESEEPEGAGLVYRPRTPESVEVVVTAMASSLFQGPEEEWTEDGRQFYRNLVTWAGAPGMGGVAGAVTDADGTPVQATISEVDGDQSRMTDPGSGDYTLPLPPGEHLLQVEALGYVTQEFTVTVTADEVVTQDVTLERAEGAGSLSGQVFSSGSASLPDDSAPGEDATPLADAQVRILETSVEATTDDEGRYAFPAVSPGTWQVEVSADGHVRSRHTVEVDGDTVHDVTMRTTVSVGIIDDYRGHMVGYLSDWGYEASDIEFTDVDRLAELDLVVAGLGSNPVEDPDAEAWAAFRDEALRTDTPVVWLDGYNRGSHGLLSTHEGDPATVGQASDEGEVTATVQDVEHPLAMDLPETFELVAPDEAYSWFGDYGGTTALSVAGANDPTHGGDLAGAKGHGAGAVDVLVGTLSPSFYGWPAYSDEGGRAWTPDAEQLLRNALTYALDATPLGAEVRAEVTDTSGAPLPATVTVVESGRTYTARDDGTVAVPLDPGTWTLRFEQFRHDPVERTVTVAAGEVVDDAVTLPTTPVGSVTGVVTDSDGPVADAELSLAGTSLRTTTDADGRYTFAEVPAGSYDIDVVTDRHFPRSFEITVTDGATTEQDVTLEIADRIAVVEDSAYGSIEGFLGGAGYNVDTFGESELGALTTTVAEYDLVVLNDSTSSFYDADLMALLDALESSRTSSIVAGQWGGGAIESVVRARGNPGTVDWGFVDDSPIHYVPDTEHPIFAGYPAGEPVTLVGTDDTNQQWLSFDDYDGTVIGSVGSPVEESLGSGVGYQFTSPESVEVLLASLGAAGYGRPEAPEGNGSRWTEDARTIYLNAVEWALTAEQGAATGVVSGPEGPVADATVSAGDGITTTTDAGGEYTLLLPDGSHTLTVTADGFEPETVPVEIDDAGEVVADVTLTPLPEVTVTGTVTSAADDSAVEGATVTGDGETVSWTATTTSDGTYTAPDVRTGEYEVTVTAPGFLAETGTLTVTTDEPALFDASLEPVDVAVLDAADSTAASDFAEWLVAEDVPAEPLAWSEATTDLSAYEVILVNGGDPSAEQYDAVVNEAADADVTLVHLGSWGADVGGLRLLEEHTNRVTIGSHGYGVGPVTVALTDPAHPIVAGLDDGAAIIGEGGYYSTVESYDGTPVADVAVSQGDGAVDRGIGIGFGATSAGGDEVVLSSSAVTPDVGPGQGWTDAHTTLLLDTITWSR